MDFIELFFRIYIYAHFTLNILGILRGLLELWTNIQIFTMLDGLHNLNILDFHWVNF